MYYASLALILLLIVAVAFLLYKLYQKQKEKLSLEANHTHLLQTLAERESRLAQKEAELSQAQQEYQKAQIAYSELQIRAEHLSEQVRSAQQESISISEQLQSQFKELATKIFEERGEMLSRKNEESLKPLREDLKRFGEQVQTTYEAEARERFSLQNVIKDLMERSGAMSKETSELIKALKGDSKVQGDWGEMILENILKHSGLTKDREYFVQETLRDEKDDVITAEGNRGGLRPDVLVRYPNGGVMIIDSKVSLSAYSNYIVATTDEERAMYAKSHLASVRKHIEELSEKKYHHFLPEAPDFVMLFIPNDPAYTLALQESPTLWEYAYKKGVILINGSNLIAALRMAQDMWQRDRQVKNVEEIIRKASSLYDKFCSYSETLLDAERKIHSASESIAKAKGQLMTGRGNLIGGLEKLKEMGVVSTKEIPSQLRTPIDE